MIPRGMIAAGVAIVAVLLLWGGRGHRDADRATARADSLATEALLDRARIDGWKAAVADTATQLLALLAASDSRAARLARELEAARARPVSRTVVVASAGGATEAPRDPGASSADSIVYLVDDGPLSGVITTWADSAAARLDWSIEIAAELVHVEGPDRRLLVFARSPDPRVRLEVPELAWEPPRVEPPGSPWGCAAAAGATGAGTVATRSWWVAAVGTALTWWQCR